MSLNRFRGFVKKFFLFLAVGFCIFFGLTMSVTMMEKKEYSNGEQGSYDGVNLVEVKFEPEATGPTGDGTTNGLNLLLINQMSEGHLKDLLSLHRDNFEGKLGTTEIKVPPNISLGINANEYGKVKGTMVPVTQIPFVGGKFIWKEPWKGIPAESMTLEGLSHEEYLSVRSTGDSNMISEGSYKGPFQMDPNYSHSNFLSNRNPVKYPNRSGQKGKWGYYPDSLYYLSTRMAKDIPGTMFIPVADYNNAVDSGKLLPEVIGILAPYIHNAGGGGAQTDIYTGAKRISPASSEHYKHISPKKIPKDVSIRLLNDYTKALLDGYSRSVDKEKVTGASHPAARLLGVIYLLEAGWNMEQSGMKYIEKNCKSAYDYVGKAHFGKDGKFVEDFLKQKIKALPVSDAQARDIYFWESASRIGGMAESGNPSKGWVYRYYDDIKVDVYDGNPQSNLVTGMQIEPLGQAFHSVVSGNYIYASILKLAGLNIDPTNPDDYMNTIQTQMPDTWVPGGPNDWLGKCGVDASKVSRGHMAVLNAAYKYTGSDYIYGGVTFPKKKCSHTLEQICDDVWAKGKGFDCADFVQMSQYDVTGEDWFKTRGASNITNDMIALNPNQEGKYMYKIKKEDLQPGDVFVTTRHTGFFLKWDDGNKKKATILHAPRTGKTVGVDSGYNIFNIPPTFLRFKHVDGINNGTVTPKGQPTEWLDDKLHISVPIKSSGKIH